MPIRAASSASSLSPTPERIHRMMDAYSQTAALNAAVDLDLFTAIGSAPAGRASAADLAQSTHAAERGVEILADFLVVQGLLNKEDGRYGLEPEAASFLDRRAPGCIAEAAHWFAYIMQRGDYNRLTEAARNGGAGNMIADPSAWTVFARSMAPLMRAPAEEAAACVAALMQRDGEARVLDIAGGHGLYGIAVARRYPRAEVTLVDAAPVAAIAMENAARAGVDGRYRTLPGSAVPGTEGEVDFGSGYRLALLTGFLHHFAPERIVELLAKSRAALAPEGEALLLDFVPNDDRVSPPAPAAFSLAMLAATAHGRAYTFAEYERMAREAGFRGLRRQDLTSAATTVMIASR